MNQKQRPLPHPDEKMPVNPVMGEPIDVWDQVNKYGTYQVQNTLDTDNPFPCIGYEGSEQACVDLANKQIKKTPEP